ncbi:NAD(P)/FAD-dependent oxidoreductase [Altericista sp. CCNU0014]|uniref:NAD(P)/FAD-dependent oxidoreductase n=1 Tax=Altericista sp. CCNU0014 TaxID=3082949 RepID=UPI00384B016F
MADFDVAVVGGGPGGSAAAITCARAGLKVALLERSPFPRPHPGETLHPGVEPILKTLEAWDAVRQANFLRHRGHSIRWFDAERFEAFGADASGDWLGFQAWRADFDAILLERAARAGACVLQPCQALRPVVASGKVTGVETNRGTIAARYVADASGSARWLERHLKLQVQTLTPRWIVRYGYGEGECPARDDSPLICADAEGWTWTARVRPHLYQWTRLWLTEPQSRADWKPEAFRQLQPVGFPRSAEVTWRIALEAAGPGYFIIGDAAATLDPASSHGVLRALMSGMMAGQSIAKAMQLGLDPAEGGAFYRAWLQQWFFHDANRLKALYSHFPTVPQWLF